jgi:hypothetical protein
MSTTPKHLSHPTRPANFNGQPTGAQLRLTFLSVVLLLLATACKKQEVAVKAALPENLPGVWVFEASYANGDKAQRTVTLAPDGNCVSTISGPGGTAGPLAGSQEGKMRVEDGYLITTVTKDGLTTNVAGLYTNRARIVRMDDRELVLEEEQVPGAVYATNQMVYRKQAK